MNRRMGWVLGLVLLLAEISAAAQVGLEWDANPPAEQITHYCVQVNGATVPPCVAGTTATVAAAVGDVLTVTAHNVAGMVSTPSTPLTVPGASAPGNPRWRVLVTVEIQAREQETYR